MVELSATSGGSLEGLFSLWKGSTLLLLHSPIDAFPKPLAAPTGQAILFHIQHTCSARIPQTRLFFEHAFKFHPSKTRALEPSGHGERRLWQHSRGGLCSFGPSAVLDTRLEACVSRWLEAKGPLWLTAPLLRDLHACAS